MKKIIIIFALSIYSLKSYSTISSYEEEYIEEENSIPDFKNFKEELDFLESETRKLNNALNEKSQSENELQAKVEDSTNENSDSVSVTSSALQKNTNKSEEIDLSDFLKTNNSLKTRRIRSR